MANADPVELDKFSQLAHRWWDPNSEFKPLHDINPLRLEWLSGLAGGLQGKRVVDVGCGGGILAESLAASGAQVTGIDLSEKALKVARLHQLESGVQVDYRLVAVEALAEETPESFDVVTCMEMLEHVPDPASVMAACARLVKPYGWVFFSTLNRNPKSYLFAILGAEYLLNLLPKGTHEWARFIKPHELASYARQGGLEPAAIMGMTYNPLTKAYKLERDTDVNYLMACRRA
ncbi:MAG: bifunctional 2-polyprenyl-6-hydroxyphenol methylase/3-demethylubiquinol 3-O-methyltransferase UbiG [Pseudomonadota bacterium]